MVTHSEKHPRSNRYHFTDRPTSITAPAVSLPTPEMPNFPVNPAADPGDYSTPRASPTAPPTTLDDGGAASSAVPGQSSQVGSGGTGSTPPGGGGPTHGPSGGYQPYAAPPTTTSFYVPGVPDPSVPFVKRVKELIAAIPPPKTSNDIFTYHCAIRRALRNTASTSWLLNPPESLTENQRILSSICSTLIHEHVPRDLFGVTTWPDDTYNLLVFFRALVPPIYDVDAQPPSPDVEFPARRSSEYMNQYTTRVELWVELYMPTIDQYVPLVQLIASWMWITHCRIFTDLRQLGATFASVHSQFTTFQSVLAWFQQCAQLRSPLPSTQNNNHYRTHRPSDSSSNSGFQGSNSNSNGNTYRTRYTNNDRASNNNHNHNNNHNRSRSNFAKGNRYNNNNSASSNNTSNSTKGGRHAHRKAYQTESVDSGPNFLSAGSAQEKSINALQSANQYTNIGWLIDSGAFLSGTPYLSDLQHPTPLNSYVSYNASGQPMEATHSGYATFTFTSASAGEGSLTITVRVLCIPSLSKRILSVSALEAAGLVPYPDSPRYLAYKRTAPEVLYVLTTRVLHPEPEANLYFVENSAINTQYIHLSQDHQITLVDHSSINSLLSTSQMSYWHSKLGHASQHRIHEFLKFNEIPAKGNFSIHDCLSCAMHRTVAKKPPPRHSQLATRPLQVLHADLSGIRRKRDDDDDFFPSLAGNRCFMLIKDDYTHYLWLAPLASKRNASSVIIRFLDTLAKHFPNLPVERFWTDQGSEFVKKHLTDYFQRHAIAFDPIPVATPALNGRIEREMRTVKESGQALLTESGLPLSMWQHAYAYAAFLHNFLPHSREGDSKVEKKPVSPFYDFFRIAHTDADLKHRIRGFIRTARLFGSGGYIKNVRGVTVNKRIPRGIEVIWCGVGTLNATFLCYIPSLGKITSESNSNFTPFHENVYVLSRLLSDLLREYRDSMGISPLDFVKETWPGRFLQLRNTLSDAAAQAIFDEELLPEADTSSVAVTDADIPNFESALTVNALVDKPYPNQHTPFVHNRSITSTCVGVPGRSREEDDHHVLMCAVHEENLDPQYLAVIVNTDLKYPVSEDPNSYKEAMGRTDAVQWQQACDVEMGMIKERNVLELVVPPKGAHIMTSRWVLKRKLSDTGVPLKYKARLVVRGFTQRHGRDYEDTFAEVVSTDILLLILNLAVQRDWHIEQLDVKSAFLYGDLDHVVYMRQPEGYEDGTNRVCRLKKSLYGLKQAPRQWFAKLSSTLKDFGFRKVSDTQGLFVCTEHQKKVYLVVYVDDILVASPDKDETVRVKSLIENALEITASGYPESYLSLHIEKTASGLTLDARKNVIKIIDEYRDSFSKYKFKKVIPILPSDAEKAVRISKMQDQLLPWDEELGKDSTPLSSWETSRYRSAVGSLNYLVSKSRPDLAFAASQLSAYLKAPTKLHWRMLMRTLKYLDITKEAKLPFSKCSKPKLYGYCDATFSGEHVRHPHGGFLWFYGDQCLFYWSSRRERRACVSIHEAELRCLINALEYGESIRNVLVFLGEMNANSTSVLYTDSQSSFNVMNNDKINRTTRRMGVHLDKVQDLMNHSKIEVKHCDGKVNLADVLTKPLSEPQFLQAVSHLIQLPEPDAQQGSVRENVNT